MWDLHENELPIPYEAEDGKAQLNVRIDARSKNECLEEEEVKSCYF